MNAASIRTCPVNLLFVIALAVGASVAAIVQSPDDLTALNAQVVKLHFQGKYAQAAEYAKQALTLIERDFGPDHRLVGKALNNLALLYANQGRFVEAELL